MHVGSRGLDLTILRVCLTIMICWRIAPVRAPGPRFCNRNETSGIRVSLLKLTGIRTLSSRSGPCARGVAWFGLNYFAGVFGHHAVDLDSGVLPSWWAHEGVEYVYTYEHGQVGASGQSVGKSHRGSPETADRPIPDTRQGKLLNSQGEHSPGGRALNVPPIGGPTLSPNLGSGSPY